VTAVLTAVLVAACLASWLAAARLLYGRMRARSIDAMIRKFPSMYGKGDKAIRRWNEEDRPWVMAAALAAALAWPLVLPGAMARRAVFRFLDSTPVLSQAEMADREKQRGQRITELEQENERLRRQQEPQP